MSWDDKATGYVKHLKNYEHELRKNHTYLTNAIKEIKKDDSSIDISNFSHIESAIRSLKSSRKRWAGGVDSPAKTVGELNLGFTPSIFVYWAKSLGNHDQLGANTTAEKLVLISNGTKLEMRLFVSENSKSVRHYGKSDVGEGLISREQLDNWGLYHRYNSGSSDYYSKAVMWYAFE